MFFPHIALNNLLYFLCAEREANFQDTPIDDDSTITIDENDEEEDSKPEPTHYTKIDLKTIKVDQLRQELRARNASSKGLYYLTLI